MSMIIEYEIMKLPGHQEISPEGVVFELGGSCPVCGGGDLKDISELRESLITSWCCGCGHMFHRRKPEAAWYRAWYGKSWDVAKPSQVVNAGGPPALRHPRESLYYFCHPALEVGNKVLDLGCGYGNDLVPFMEFGCEAYGCEASEHRAEAAEAAGIEVAHVTAEDLSEETFGCRFDMALSNHVLEHVVDPHAYMRSIRGVLKPGGWLCLTVPNLANDFMLHDFFFGLHIHFFSRGSLERLLRMHGFVVHRVLEEHQLRILARYEPGEVGEGKGGGDADCFEVDGLNVGCAVPEEGILASVFGRGDFKLGDEVYCHWGKARVRLRHASEVSYDSSLREEARHGMHLVVKEGGGLPLVFESTVPGGAANFWAK